jgi:UDP-N-acetylmuramoylalanine--D-glutamate ligase
MAALAVGRVLRVPLDVMVEVLRQGVPTPHRCERLGEVHGVEFINDAKASNLDALHKALLSLPPKPGGEPHVWLLAGGRDDGQEFHDVGPLLSQRAKGAFLFGPARERMRAAWSLFTPCTLVGSLLEGVQDAARNATPGDVVLFSPACASSEPFQDYEERGHAFRQTVRNWEPSAPPTLAAPVGRRLGMVEPAA